MADIADYGDSDLGRIRAELGKKSSFVRAAQELQGYIASGRYHCLDKPLTRDDGVWKLTERASTLLKTRYTGDNYWRNGQDLFQACRARYCSHGLAFLLPIFVSIHIEVCNTGCPIITMRSMTNSSLWIVQTNIAGRGRG